MVSTIHSSEYTPVKPKKTRKPATLTVRSVDHDKCLWLAYEIAAAKLSKKDRDWVISRYIELVDFYLKNNTLSGYKDIDTNLTKTLETIFKAHFQHFIAKPNSGRLIFVSGSNRQCRSMDYFNSTQPNRSASASSVQTLENLTTYYNLNNPDNLATKNTLLLADIHANQPIGTTFDAIKSEVESNHGTYVTDKASTSSDKKIDLLCEIDPYKFTSAYAQMHEAASAHPEEIIDVEFTDDNVDILNSLRDFYTAHKECMPHNVRLCLRSYDMTGESTQTFVPVDIEGTGAINTQWQQTVRYAIEENAIDANLPELGDTVQDKAAKATSLFAIHFEIAAITPQSSQKTIDALAQKMIDHGGNHPGFLKHVFSGELNTSQRLLQTAVFDALDKRLKLYETCRQENTAAQQKLIDLEQTVLGRSARGSWRSIPAWANWVAAPGEWSLSNWWSGEYNKKLPSNKEACVTLWPWETVQLDCQYQRKIQMPVTPNIVVNSTPETTPEKNSASADTQKFVTDSFRCSANALLPFWLRGQTEKDKQANAASWSYSFCSWPTKSDVLPSIKRGKERYKAANESLDEASAHLITQRDDLTKSLTQRFVKLVNEAAINTNAFANPIQHDLAGRIYNVQDDNGQITMHLANTAPINVFEGNSSNITNRFTCWLTSEDHSQNNVKVAMRLGVEETGEGKKWGQLITAQLTSLQHTVDQQLTLALRTFVASLRTANPNITEADLKPIFAMARVQLINDLRIQIQEAFSKSYGNEACHLDAKGFGRLQTKLEQIHKKVPKMVLPVVAAKLSETRAFKDVFGKGTDTRAAIKEQSRPLYDALKAAAPTQSCGERMASFGNAMWAKLPSLGFNAYKSVPTVSPIK